MQRRFAAKKEMIRNAKREVRTFDDLEALESERIMDVEQGLLHRLEFTCQTRNLYDKAAAGQRL